MVAATKPRWQQVTALVSLSAGGTVTGCSFIPASAADLTGPASMPIRLMALEQAARPAAAGDSALRSAIVNVASYYLRMARSKTPAAMEAIIWQHDSIDGVDHGESCAAFASLTLELAAQVTGQQSWVTGGTTYPWPLHKWADVRVDPNPESPDIISVLQDAQAHSRWHPLGDGYQPLPGDWVLFDGHVEVVTKYAGGTLYTIGGDSLPNFSVNSHEYPGPLAAQGVAGFVNNGDLGGAAATAARDPAVTGHAAGRSAAQDPAATAAGQPAIPGTPAAGPAGPARTAAAPHGAAAAAGRQVSGAAIPGVPAAATRRDARPRRSLHRSPRTGHAVHEPGGSTARRPAQPASIPGTGASAQPPHASHPGARRAAENGAAIPGLPAFPRQPSAPAASQASPYRRCQPAATAAPAQTPAARQAFIDQVAPGAIATQRRYGVPAAVTIAQAIDESGWGQSELAVKDHNLFGIKGTGPAGSDALPTQEYQNGQWVSISAPFRVYHNVAESIDDHAELLATSGYYTQAMAARNEPDAFASALTGVYATNPGYGSQLIQIMQQYHLYRYDVRPPAGRTARAARSVRPSPAPSRPAAPAARRSALRAEPHRSQASWARIPGVASSAPAPDVSRAAPRPAAAGPRTRSPGKPPRPARRAAPEPATLSAAYQPMAAPFHHDLPGRTSYQAHLPAQVKEAFIRLAKAPITRAELLYRDVARQCGIPWELVAACDWMQCEARPRYSPVHGEKLGSVNADGTVYRTKSAALEQCAIELAGLARAVYGIDLTSAGVVSVTDLANAFAAFRWGGLLKLHRTSAMEFPYSVAGLSAQHLNMRWPDIAADAPDKPGGRFRMPFGAVPVVLSLSYPATA